jgi:hypothetical protein
MNNANWRETLMPFPCFQKQNRHSSGCVSHFFLTAETPKKIKRKNFATLCDFAVQLFQPQRSQEKSREKNFATLGAFAVKKNRMRNRITMSASPTSPLTPHP